MSRTRTDRSLAIAGMVALGFAVATVGIHAGQGRGGGGNGGGSGDTPLIMVFRDGPGDKLHSDGGGEYVHNEQGVHVFLDQGGEIRFDLVQPKGPNPVPERHLEIELDDNLVPGVLPPSSDTAWNAYFHISADDTTVRDVTTTAVARFPIFGEKKSAFDGWRLWYSDDNLVTEGYSQRVTVECMATVGAPGSETCTAWHIDKSDDAASLFGGGGYSIWNVPFAIGVCLQSAYADGAACYNAVFNPGS